MWNFLRLALLAMMLTACASNPYGMGQRQGYFLGTAAITSNVPNLCAASNNKYAFKAQQYWLTGGSGATWYGCSAQHTANLNPEYIINYSIIKNDGTGQNVVSTCIPQYQGKDADIHFTQMDVIVQLHEGNPTCQAILS
jgi:hypothetical protein